MEGGSDGGRKGGMESRKDVGRKKQGGGWEGDREKKGMRERKKDRQRETERRRNIKRESVRACARQCASERER